MNVEELQFSFGFIQWLIMAAVGLYAWWVGRQSASQQDLLDLRTRLVKLEVEMAQVPSQAALHEVLAKLERVAANAETAREVMSSMQSSLARINDYLLNNK